MEDLDKEAMLALLSSENRDHLDSCGYVWRRELGVVWTNPEGQWRCQQFTHCACFRMPGGPFEIDSGNRVRPVADAKP